MEQQDPISLTALRADLYNRIDRLIETGVPLRLERNGHELEISLKGAEKPLSGSKISRIIPHEDLFPDPDNPNLDYDFEAEWMKEVDEFY